jgi:(heptosyl)LPS beta-1,4-glucosyltransferase
MLSVVIATWNEENNLPRVIASVRDLADEIVVVDTGSTDRTVAVAKKLGCKVYHHANTSVVEPVRNFSISKAQGDWVLVLDADEEVPATLAQKISEIINKPTADYYRIPRKSIIFGKWIVSDHWWPDYVYRLFKKGKLSWDNSIHSIPFTKGTGADLPASEDVAFIHHHYETISQYILRLNRYTDVQQKEISAMGYNFSWKDLLNKPLAEFVNQYFARRGYSQGVHGLALALLQSVSELVLYLKLWQADGFVEQKINKTDLTSVLSARAKEYNWWEYEVRIRQANWITKPVWKARRWLKV